MRPTQLNFKSPQERTAEFKTFQINNMGGNLNFLQRTQNQSGSILPKEPRFKDKPLYDKGTGQTCFLGPGSYNDHQSFIDLNKHSCPSKIMPITALPPRESGQQCYIMIGDQIKYEPSWQLSSKKQLLKDTAVNDCLSSATAGLNSNSMSKIKKSKREQYQQSYSRASTGAIQAEDVGLKSRFGRTRTMSRSTARRQNLRGLTSDIHGAQAQQESQIDEIMFSHEQQLKQRNASVPGTNQVRPQTCSTCSRPFETPANQGILNLNSEDFSEQQRVLNRPSSMSRHSPSGRAPLYQVSKQALTQSMRQSVEPVPTTKGEQIYLNMESNEMLGQRHESEVAVTVQKGEKTMNSNLEEIQDHATASNTTANLHQHGAHTALSVGLSPANLSIQRNRQRSEAQMFETHAMVGVGNILNNYESFQGVNMARPFNQRINANRFMKTTKLVSTKRTDLKARSIMPKTAINYYNLRKGLYLKNGGRGVSLSRDNCKMIASHDQCMAKSVGILNAYGELAGVQEGETEGGISAQLNQFHRNQNRSGSQSMGLQTVISPKTMTPGTVQTGVNETPLTVQVDIDAQMIQAPPQTVPNTSTVGKQVFTPGELPAYNYSHAAMTRSRKRKEARRSAPKTTYFDSALASNSNYMNVIKESHESILRRKNLEQEKRRILNMDFKKRSDKEDWEKLNKFLQGRQSQATEEEATPKYMGQGLTNPQAFTEDVNQ